jgi:hypothetical protein
MKRILLIALAVLALFAPAPGRGQTGGADGSPAAEGDFGVDDLEPFVRVDSVRNDWQTRFPNDESLRDFKRLREYRTEKQGTLLEQQQQLTRYTGLLEQAEAYGRAQRQEREAIETALKGVPDTASSIRVEQSLSATTDRELGFTTPGTGPAVRVREYQRKLADRDTRAKRYLESLRSSVVQLKNNVELLTGVIRRSESAIDAALAPEYRDMSFRSQVSIFFSVLIAIMIVSFFVVIYRKSANTGGAMLLSDGGLQFITLFVLIIAIILFGILKILEGRELAAILSGIAGYILGRGSQPKAPPSGADPAAPAPMLKIVHPEPPGKAAAPGDPVDPGVPPRTVV